MTINSGAAEAVWELPNCAVHLPGDRGYDLTRTPWNLAFEQRPAAVAVPRSVEDVSEVVTAARRAGLRIAPQATGHGASFLRDGLADAVLMRMNEFTGVAIDPAETTARVTGGTPWQDVVDAAGVHGLAGMHGSGSDIAVVGYNLGGGLSWYARGHGVTSNWVRAVEIITPDGRVVRADATNEADLFWAVRGGGGAFGVVTALEIELLDMPETYGGFMLWDGKDAERVVHAWARWTRTAPESVSTSIRVASFPSSPQIPEHLRGRKLVLVEGADVGDQPEEVFAELRALKPEMDTYAVLSVTAVPDMGTEPRAPSAGIGGHVLLDDIPERALDTLLSIAGPESETALRFAEVRHLGGALSRPNVTGGALDHVREGYALYCRAAAPTSEELERGRDAAAELVDALTPYGSGRELSNLSEYPEGARCFDPDVLSRLLDVRDAADPERVLVAGDWLGERATD